MLGGTRLGGVAGAGGVFAFMVSTVCLLTDMFRLLRGKPFLVLAAFRWGVLAVILDRRSTAQRAWALTTSTTTTFTTIAARKVLTQREHRKGGAENGENVITS